MPFPVEESRIRKAEEAPGVRFPGSYRRRMQRDNGGELVVEEEGWWLFPILDDSDRKRLARTCNDVVRETRLSREWPGFPADGVAIADNEAGDRLIFLPDTADQQQLSSMVWCWRHDEAGDLEAFGEIFEGNED